MSLFVTLSGLHLKLVDGSHISASKSQGVLYYQWRIPSLRVNLLIKSPSDHLLTAVAPRLSCLLFALEPTGTNYWACEMIAMLLIPFGADM